MLMTPIWSESWVEMTRVMMIMRIWSRPAAAPKTGLFDQGHSPSEKKKRVRYIHTIIRVLEHSSSAHVHPIIRFFGHTDADIYQIMRAFTESSGHLDIPPIKHIHSIISVIGLSCGHLPYNKGIHQIVRAFTLLESHSSRKIDEGLW